MNSSLSHNHHAHHHERRPRRSTLKKKVMNILKPFRHHHHHHHHETTGSSKHHPIDHSTSHSDTSKTWDESAELVVMGGRRGSSLPIIVNPLEGAEISHGDASVSTLGTTSHDHDDVVTTTIGSTSFDDDEDEEIDVDLFMEHRRKGADAGNQHQFVSQRKERLPQELLVEIVLFRWPLHRMEATNYKKQPQELLKEITITYKSKRVTQPEPIKIHPVELLKDIKNFSKDSLLPIQKVEEEEEEAKPEDEEEEQAEEAKPEAATKDDDSSNVELVALKERCANLSTVAELLSKQLVESTLTKEQASINKRKEIKYYQDVIRKLEDKYRAECSSLVSDKKYLEGQLQRTKIESIPPVVVQQRRRRSDSTTTKEERKGGGGQQQQRRHSFMDTLVAPVEACLRSPVLSAHRASFSMASAMIMQNKLMPAMISAVARTDE